MFVEENHFYFMKDSYFRDFPEAGLMPNKIIVNNAVHDRPAYFALRDSTDPEILWFIPISSKISKYKRIAEEKKENSVVATRSYLEIFSVMNAHF